MGVINIIQIILKRMEQIYERIPIKLPGDIFYFAFLLVLAYDYGFLTTFDREPFKFLYITGAVLAGIVLIIRFLNSKNEKRSYIIVSAILLLFGCGYLLFRHSVYFLVLVVLMVGAHRIEAKKIFTLYLLLSTVLFVLMVTYFLHTNTGAVGSWVKTPQVNFGSINSTDCQGMLFFIIVAYLFLKGKRIEYMELVVLAGTVLWFWSHTFAEINMYCSLTCLMIAACMKTGTVLNNGQRFHNCRWPGYIVSASFVILAAIMIVLSVKYDPDSEKWISINRILHLRLTTPHTLFNRFPPRMWGNEFVIVGWGYDPNIPDVQEMIAQYGYTYVDSSYPQILIMHGYLIFAMIIGAMTHVSYRYAKKGELYKVLLLAVLAVNFAAEGHMKELSCNVWLLLPFADLTDCEEPQKLETRNSQGTE